MQNSYTKEGQFSWWLAPLWFHIEPLPFKTENYFNFYPGPPSPPILRAYGFGHGPYIYQGPGPARPVDQSTGSMARPGLGHGPYSSGPAHWRPLNLLSSKTLISDISSYFIFIIIIYIYFV